MSTFGPALLLDGPLPRPPRHHLLTAAQEVPDSLDNDGGVNERWANGVNVLPYPDGLPEGHDPCSSGTFRAKSEGEAQDAFPQFNAFTAYMPVRCTSSGIGDDDEFRARAIAALSAATPWAVERQLVSGNVMPLNPFLGDSNVDILDGTGVAALKALRIAEQAIAATGKQGLVHMTAATATELADVLIEDGDRLRTIVGTPVAVGYGYEGQAPDGEAAPSDDESWLWVTGPVLYKLSDPLVNPPTIREALDRSTNDVVYRAERDVLVAWDTLLQGAVLVDHA